MTFQEDELLAVALGISDGLRFLHAEGVTHRDVKPENLIYCQSQKQIKLIDFSLAELAPKGAQTGIRGRDGTQGFMAPEVLVNSQEGYGPSCDIFSFGCVLHKMLAGHLPHADVANNRVITCIPQRLTIETQRLVESLLAADPMDRPNASEAYEICARLAAQDFGPANASQDFWHPRLDIL